MVKFLLSLNLDLIFEFHKLKKKHSFRYLVIARCEKIIHREGWTEVKWAVLLPTKAQLSGLMVGPTYLSAQMKLWTSILSHSLLPNTTLLTAGQADWCGMAVVHSPHPFFAPLPATAKRPNFATRSWAGRAGFPVLLCLPRSDNVSSTNTFAGAALSDTASSQKYVYPDPVPEFAESVRFPPWTHCPSSIRGSFVSFLLS